MKHILIPALLIAALAAQPLSARGRDRDYAGVRRQLFVAPNGKPYRGQPGEPYPSAAWFAGADTDHDGKLTRAEYRADFNAYFDELDTNKDGEIDPQEIEHYETVILPEVRMTPSAFGGYVSDNPDSSGSGSSSSARRVMTRPSGAAFFSYFGAPEPLVAMDANFNRGISRAEYANIAERSFSALDTESRGYLVLDTLPKTAAQR